LLAGVDSRAKNKKGKKREESKHKAQRRGDWGGEKGELKIGEFVVMAFC